MNLSGKKTLIHGLGRHGGGVAAARYCAQQGARVTVTDLADESSLAESLAQLSDLPIERFVLGEHREQGFQDADVVVVNPAVRPDDRFIQMCATGSASAGRGAGPIITSEIELFLNACPAMVVGVTGTVGKSTTAAMLAAIVKAAGRKTWLGGNIGNSLLDDLPQIERRDLVVLELSSFQLFWLSETARWPRAAIVTNCSPNHLDWHGSWDHYVAAKQRLVAHVPADGCCVLNTNSPGLDSWHRLAGGQQIPLETEPTQLPLQLLGRANQANAGCSAAMARALGVEQSITADAIRQFPGLPHRLQIVGDKQGRHFVNDSKSTTPVAAIAALGVFGRDTWLLLGGADAKADFTELVDTVVRSAAGAAVYGTTAEKLSTLIRHRDSSFPCLKASTLSEAFAWSVAQSKPGDTILLSPACPSTDQFRDFTHRGGEFERLVASV